MRSKLRDIATRIAAIIGEDPVMTDSGNLSVVVEDKGDYAFKIAQALGSLGVCVTVAVTGFRRVDRSPVLEGTVDLEISTYENPALNRADESYMTAQKAMERISEILHYAMIDGLEHPVIFKDFRREDVDDANIVRGSFETHAKLGSTGDD